MNNIQDFDIELIVPNPYQPRLEEDQEHVQEIAASIARDNLLQVPSGRAVDGNIELAFGMTRLAAFKLLASIEAGFTDLIPEELVELVEAARKAGRSFTQMPVQVVELGDEQMFEYSIIENVQRKNLNDIETATAMRTHMETFGHTAAETGVLFNNASASTVRGKVRLLNLPESVQGMMKDGKLHLNDARRLLTLQRVAPDQVESIAEKLSQEGRGEPPEEIIAETLSKAKSTLEMWSRWGDQENPKAGSGLWPLAMGPKEFPMDLLDKLEAKTAAKALGIKLTAENREPLNDIIVALEYNPESAEKLVQDGAPEEDIERLALLIDPPACTACDFYVRMKKAQYCAFKACHERKSAAWAKQLAQAASQEKDIAIYDEEKDGKDVFLLDSWMNRDILEDENPDVRLIPKAGQAAYASGVDTAHVRAVAVGETARRLKEQAQAKKAAEKERESNAESWEERQARWELERQRKTAAYTFLWHEATAVFAQVFEGITVLRPLEVLAENTRRDDVIPDEDVPADSASKKKKLPYLRRRVVFSVLEDLMPDNEIEVQREPVHFVAKHLQGIATEWGVTLPANWLEWAGQAEFVQEVAYEIQEEPA